MRAAVAGLVEAAGRLLLLLMSLSLGVVKLLLGVAVLLLLEVLLLVVAYKPYRTNTYWPGESRSRGH